MKLISWNVNGLRSVTKKGLASFLEKEQPDILCLQETKIDAKHKDWDSLIPENYSVVRSSAEKKGYSGVATFIKEPLSFETKALGIGESRFDREGRFAITTHQLGSRSKFTLYNIYFPSGTSGEERQSFKYDFLDSLYEHLSGLSEVERKNLIICGDFNICHRPIDIHHPDVAEKRELSGYLPEERAWMDRFVELGFLDTFRQVRGDENGRYSWWSFRAASRQKNLGWRIDYFFVSKALKSKVKDANLYESVAGSDHCPLVLEL